MLPSLTTLAALLAQVATPPASDPAVRVWLADTVLPVGAAARVYVNLRQPGYLVVLHVGPSGRIRVLFPIHPGDEDSVTGPDLRAAVRVSGTGTGTVVAVRSSWPFEFSGVRAGADWDYERGMLFQPTAGDPLAALLDIADRVTAGRAYSYDVAGYHTPGSVAVRHQAPGDICLGCVRRGEATDDPAGAAVSAYRGSPGQRAAVDCSGAHLVDSFCGVVDNHVASTTTYYEAYPVYVPVLVGIPAVRRFFDAGAARRPVGPAPPPAAEPSASGAAMSLPAAPQVLVPSRALLRTVRTRRP